MEGAEKIRIGLLALQGAFQLHERHISALGAQYVPVVEVDDFKGIDGLILPGGESGVMLKLIEATGIKKNLSDFLIEKPVWGICAGAILMAKTVQNPHQESFGSMEIEIERNAYGSQLESCQETVNDYQVSYIRAPRISAVKDTIRILSKRDGSPTWIDFENSMITTFHPETNLRAPSPWHRIFLDMCLKARNDLKKTHSPPEKDDEKGNLNLSDSWL